MPRLLKSKMKKNRGPVKRIQRLIQQIEKRFYKIASRLSVAQKMSAFLPVSCLITKIKPPNRSLSSSFIFTPTQESTKTPGFPQPPERPENKKNGHTISFK